MKYSNNKVQDLKIAYIGGLSWRGYVMNGEWIGEYPI